MTAQSIYTSEVPSNHNVFDNSAITLATSFYTTVDTLIDAGRWWAASNRPAGGTYELVLFEATAEDNGGGAGFALDSVSIPNASVPLDQWTAWQPLSAGPVKVRGYHIYKMGLRTSLGSYTATGHFFQSAPLVSGDFVAPKDITLIPGIGSYWNGSFATDITSYPTQHFNETAYFVDARIPDLAGQLTLVGLQKVTANSGSGALTINITPDAGDVVVVKLTTWDTNVSTSLTTSSGGEMFTRQGAVAPGGFRPWVAIDTCPITVRPSAPITLSTTPSGAARRNMVVEIWRNATIGNFASANSGTTTLAGSINLTSGSQLSWVATDIQSRDPVNSSYLNGAVVEYLDDGHVGANSVSYFLRQAAGSGGSGIAFGMTNTNGDAYSGCIAGIELKQATGGGTTPVGRSLDMPWAVRGPVGRSLDVPWAQRGPVGRTLDTPWIVRGAVGRTLDMPWSVQGAPESTVRLPSVGVANLTPRLTAYPDGGITAFL